jgi:hypothetical protein
VLPNRPSTYLLTFLLALLVAVVAWIFHALNSPVLQEAVARKKSPGSSPRTQETAPVMPLPEAGETPQFSTGGVDLELQAKADSLHSDEHGPEQDLQIVADFLETYARATGGQPIGDNADITAALSGTQFPGQKARVFPRQHRAVKNGQLVDRWGEALWFHPNSGNSMEIRSGGPDKQLFTPDDVILNPSPGGFGATPPASGETPQ